MNKPILLVLMCVLVTGCAKKVDFKEGVQLDAGARNPDSKTLECGAPPFIVNYTNVDSKVGTLEVNNKGVCKLTVRVGEDAGGGAVTQITTYEVDTGLGNITAFPMTEKQKLTLSFACQPSTAAGGCIFSYKFSPGTLADKPTKESVDADPSGQVTPQGQTSGNMCITQPGRESVVKVISNRLTNGEVKVTFTAQSSCKCDPFTVYGEPEARKNRQAKAPPEGTGNGVAIVPAGENVSLKVKCGPASNTTETCKGIVKDIQIAISTK